MNITRLTLIMVVGLLEFCMTIPVQKYGKCTAGNCSNGFGAAILLNGTYIGHWRSGKPNGVGTQTFLNGRKFMGNFSDGRIKGQGKYILADGRIVKGNWETPNVFTSWYYGYMLPNSCS